MDIIKIIQEHSLVVRCLPKEVVSYWAYTEGAETKKYVNEKGEEIEAIREVVIQEHDLKYFKNVKPTKYCTDSPEKRYENWKKNYPNGKKILKETKQVKNGGYWYVKRACNTNSTIIFNNKTDFIAPTIEEAIQLFLNSL